MPPPGTASAYFRFPGLCHTSGDEKIVAAEGMRTVDTDIDVDDAMASDATRTVAAILASIKPGSIVLLHLNGPPNAALTAPILQGILPALAARGLTPVTLRDLLNSK